MKLKFDATLVHQKQAINAVVQVFDSQPVEQSNFEISASKDNEILFNELGVGNQIIWSDKQLLDNVQKIQANNNIKKISDLEGQGHNFSIEMETGTGKTYVYLRTIFELSKKYGLKKFIIVVPSVAIREGVLKSIEMTKEHFRTLYDNEPFNYFVYDSRKLGTVRQFANSNEIQIMVINIQSFQRDVPDTDRNAAEMTEQELQNLNVIYRENDKMSGYKPIEFIQATKPVVIIDEPQSVDNTQKAKRAIEKLNPIAILRYSATHRDPYNLLYRLDPVRAQDLNLVKRIEVASVRSDDNFNNAYVKLFKTDNKRGIKARIEIHKESGGNIRTTKLWVKQGDDLFVKSGERENYREGYIIRNIDCTPGAEHIELSNGKCLDLGTEIGGLGDDIMKAQIKDTVEQHLEKERILRGKKIKVLSLFFIDKVANYRIYNGAEATSLGKIGQWFEEAYKELTAKSRYTDFAPQALGYDISKIHNGYFSQDGRTGKWKDSTERGNKDDDNTYNLIMRDKERLLDPEEPLRFIFSHSALREGWDNPNVFQICTLNETANVDKKRQQIGRGLRLPVNAQGERIHDEKINRLTVIANESYKDFAMSLQNELEEDFGIKFGQIKKISFAQIMRDRDGEKQPIGQEESGKIWDELRNAGYINASGEIQDSFAPDNNAFELKIDKKYNDIEPRIIDTMKLFIFENRVVNARRQKQELKFKKKVYLSPEFKALWDKIKHRTRYSVSFDTKQLIQSATQRIKKMDAIKPGQTTTTRVGIDLSEAGISADRILNERQARTTGVPVLPDLLYHLQKETELTRHTLVEILKRSGKLSDFETNPQQFIVSVMYKISQALHDLMLDGIQYEKIADHYWEMSRIKKEAEDRIVRYLENLHVVQNQDKCLFDAVECDSAVEKRFAKDLDNHENIRLFVKLPGWFKIDTPIGPYNPDWAFVAERDKTLYFVCETKSTTNEKELRIEEKQKTDYGKHHFKAIAVDYDVVTTLSDVDF